MAKQNSTKNGSNSLSRHSRLRLWSGKNPRKTVFLALLVALIAWLGASLIAQYIQRNHEKAQFIQAKVELDDIYTQIVKQVGQPTAHKATQTCSYTSEEFSRGFLYCQLHVYTYFQGLAPPLMNKTVKQVAETIRASSYVTAVDPFTAGELSKSYSDGLNLKADDFLVPHMKKCSVDYWYLTHGQPYATPAFTVGTFPGLFVDITCSSNALAAYFPVVKN